MTAGWCSHPHPSGGGNWFWAGPCTTLGPCGPFYCRGRGAQGHQGWNRSDDLKQNSFLLSPSWDDKIHSHLPDDVACKILPFKPGFLRFLLSSLKGQVLLWTSVSFLSLFLSLSLSHLRLSPSHCHLLSCLLFSSFCNYKIYTCLSSFAIQPLIKCWILWDTY